MNPFDAFVRNLDPATGKSVHDASATKTQQRIDTLSAVFPDPESARSAAARTRQYVLDHLKPLVLSLEEQCHKNGIVVHWARDAKEARSVILGLCRQSCRPGAVIVKAKSMATEEIHLNHALADAGYDVVETDLGEFVVQLDHDTPSHIVTPIIHKNRYQVARLFEENNIGTYTEKPEELTSQARRHLRTQFRRAEVGISGVNFAVAETGRLVLVENEGNSRLSTTAPRVHIAVMGIEKVLPSEADLPLFLRLLAGSATGQRATVYTHFIHGPRKPEALDGPDEVHLVILDNGRLDALAGPYRDILRCIRCGACLNVCPVYRQGSGHAYGHVYSGPLGAVLAPALEGVGLAAIAKASSLCGACEEVCPVKIPIPELLLHLRDQGVREKTIVDPIPWSGFVAVATRAYLWRTSLQAVPMAKLVPNPWSRHRHMPRRDGRDFRRWFRERA